ncbi:LCP family protein [Streptomyces sp. NPDC051561]|uniref:LCP family protein n=1 Tax=Streptomyces sp. NPDC051561 TaxID=3365658 RepID=UPI00378EEF41
MQPSRSRSGRSRSGPRSRRRLALAALLVASLAVGPLPATADAPAPYTLAHDSTLSPAARMAPGTNLLVVGIDRRSGLTPQQKQRLFVNGKECDCTDVMMLVHLAEDGKRLSVVSLPRDSYVRFAPHDHPQHSGKINGAFQHGGPDLAVRTVERATGIRVDHYLETGFEDFATAVDRLGGAKVCTDRLLEDPKSGLRLPPGTHLLDGPGALRYARARKVSPPGDLGRVRRQQRVLLGMIDRLSAAGVFKDPMALAGAAQALLPQLRTDAGTGLSTLFSIGWQLRELSPAQLEFATVPMSAFDHRVAQWGSTLLWDDARAARLFSALREDRPITQELSLQAVPVAMAPSTVPVRVDDPDVAEGLRRSGFDVTKAQAPLVRAEGPTVITYDPYWDRYASTLAAALPGAKLNPVAGHGHVFQVKVGNGGRQVAEVTYDRSMVEGAPSTGEQLRCP